ncbi:MAG: thiolase family protein [Rhodobacteraceae bacterium]|nr:thiolase family protein [Paracoccaceae bacterium]
MTSAAYIIAAHRTPVTPEGGGLSRLVLHKLAAPVLLACLRETPVRADQVDEVILANALYGGGNPARMAALAAGLPESVAGLSIDRQCVGGLDAVLLATRMIQSGAANVVLAGGAESHSRRPVRMATNPDGGDPQTYDRPPFSPWPERDPDMHEAAAALAEHAGISRTEQDAFAMESHRKARCNGQNYSTELVALAGVSADAFTRDLSPALCARAKPLVGTITAANAAISADAASFLLVVNEAIARQVTNQRPLRVAAGRTIGSDPEWPGLAPVQAIRETLTAASARPSDLTVSEIMEAYAVQAIACQRQAGLDPATMNRSGGALARGHPIGASGAINAVRLFHEMQAAGGKGLAAIAAAGGLGTALLLEG